MIILIFVLIIVVILFWVRDLTQKRDYQQFQQSKVFFQLHSLLEACETINNRHHISEIFLEPSSNYQTSYFKLYIRIQGIANDITALEDYLINFENKVIRESESPLNNHNLILLPDHVRIDSVKATMKNATTSRTKFQHTVESAFYNLLFDKDTSQCKTIYSPFEHYASSAGRYVIDNDLWEISGEDAIYKQLIYFEDVKQKNIICFFAKTVRAFFPSVTIRRTQNGCIIKR